MAVLCEELKTLIAESLNASLKARMKYTGEQIPDQQILQPASDTLAGIDFKFYEMKIRAEEFFVSPKHILAVFDNCLLIYSYSSSLSVKLRKRVPISYLLYMRRQLNRSARRFLYRIYLNLIDSNVYRYEAWFEAILSHINIGRVTDIIEYRGGVSVEYFGGSKVYYDLFLNVCTESSLSVQCAEPGYSSYRFSIGRSGLRITHDGCTLVSEYKIDHVRDYVIIGGNIFVLTNSNIVVARLTECS